MITRLDRKGCSNLVSAIILLAVRDWRKAEEMLRRVPGDKASVALEKDTREFFESGWYQDLRDGLGRDLPGDMMKVLREAI